MTSDQIRTLVLFALVVGGIYLLLIRPTRKRAQEVKALQHALGIGAEVMLTSGIFGTVRTIADEKVQVEVADGIILTVHRGAIGKVLTSAPDADADLDQVPAAEIGNEDGHIDVEPRVTDADSDVDSVTGADADPASDERRGEH